MLPCFFLLAIIDLYSRDLLWIAADIMGRNSPTLVNQSFGLSVEQQFRCPNAMNAMFKGSRQRTVKNLPLDIMFCIRH